MIIYWMAATGDTAVFLHEVKALFLFIIKAPTKQVCASDTLLPFLEGTYNQISSQNHSQP